MESSLFEQLVIFIVYQNSAMYQKHFYHLIQEIGHKQILGSIFDVEWDGEKET